MKNSDMTGKQILENRERTKRWRDNNPEQVAKIRYSPKGRWQIFISKAKARGISLTITFEEWLGDWRGMSLLQADYS